MLSVLACFVKYSLFVLNFEGIFVKIMSSTGCGWLDLVHAAPPNENQSESGKGWRRVSQSELLLPHVDAHDVTIKKSSVAKTNCG